MEDCIAELLAMQSDLDEISLRIKQAARRSAAVVDVLTPALARVQQLERSAATLRRVMSQQWTAEQAAYWKDNQQQLNSFSSDVHCHGLGGEKVCRKGGDDV